MPAQLSDVWFITGCSSGFGRELAKLVLDRGYRAVITARDPRTIQDLAAGRDGRALALKLDVTNKSEVAEAVATAQLRKVKRTKFGPWWTRIFLAWHG